MGFPVELGLNASDRCVDFQPNDKTASNRRGVNPARVTWGVWHGPTCWEIDVSDLTHHDRYDYSPITERPDFDWPNGRRLAIHIGINVE
jgi:hypothetical protein